MSPQAQPNQTKYQQNRLESGLMFSLYPQTIAEYIIHM